MRNIFFVLFSIASFCSTAQTRKPIPFANGTPADTALTPGQCKAGAGFWIAPNSYNIPKLAANGTITTSKLYDSSNRCIVGDSLIVTGNATFSDTVFCGNVPPATLSTDRILVLGSSKGTIRSIAPPTWGAGVIFSYPADSGYIDTGFVATRSYVATHSGSGTVTSVSTGTGLLGGPITTTGTLTPDTTYLATVTRAGRDTLNLYNTTIKYADTVSKIATQYQMAPYFKTGGNTFGATSSIGNTDAYSLTLKTNNKAWDVISTTGERTINANSTHSSGNSYGYQFIDTVAGTGTNIHHAFNITIPAGYTIGSSLAAFEIYLGATQLFNVTSAGSINAVGATFTGSVALNAGASVTAGLTSTWNNSTHGRALTINQQNTTGGDAIFYEQNTGVTVDSDDNKGGHRQLNSSGLNTYSGRVVMGSQTDDGSNELQVTGNIALKAAGNKLIITEGANACSGLSSIMSGGTITVSTTCITANSRVLLIGVSTSAPPCASCGDLSLGAVIAGTSFVINSASATDTRAVQWFIYN